MRKFTKFNADKLDKKIVIRAVAVSLAVILVVCSVLFLLDRWESTPDDESVTPPVAEDTMQYNGKEYTKKSNLFTLLVMGLDETSEEINSHETSYNNSQEADFLMLLVFDTRNSTYSALHINRDSMAKITTLNPTGETNSDIKQIALSHTYGDGKAQSCKFTVDAVQGLLDGIEIDAYISAPMDVVGKVTDFVGGVEVTVLQDMTSVYENWTEGAVVTLDKDNALQYVRTRYGLDESSNAVRMERQQQYLEALFEKCVSAINNDNKFVENFFSSDLMDNLEATQLTRIESIAKNLPEYKYTGVYELEGESKVVSAANDQQNMEFYPDAESVKETVITLYYEPVKE